MSVRNSQNKLKAMVIQTGARHGYAIPQMLEKAGCLHSFHTSMAFRQDPSFVKSLVQTILPHRRASIERRVVRGVSSQKVYPNISADFARMFALKRSGSKMTARLAYSHQLGARTIRCSDYAANVAMFVDDSGGPELMRSLRRRGIPIAIDIVITPMAYETTAASALEWPNWNGAVFSASERAQFIQMYEAVIGLADLVMYPSEGVLQGLRQIKAFDESKSVLVPYALGGIDPVPSRPKPGRVLFAGSEPLRKGLPYLAAAARSLRAQGFDYEFVIAGTISKSIRELDDCRELTFLGHISREEMSHQMSLADVFCLPSLAEGQAGVTLEALASGVPCVVTPSAGAPVRHLQNGLIVPERDAIKLASALTEVIENRNLRRTLAENAIVGKDEFSKNSIREKLVNALSSLLDTRR